MPREIDPILLEVFRNAFESGADQMALILMRTAHSPIVRDAMDFSTALCDAAGHNLAQGLTTPMHLGSFYDAMRHLIGQYAGRIEPGDVFIANDPYLASGQHLPDIYVVRPLFAGTTLVGWAATIAHHVDVGGLVPGSNSLAAVEIHQEGLRLPFVKLAQGGVTNSMLLEIIAANVRVPDQVLGDLHAQMATAPRPSWPTAMHCRTIRNAWRGRRSAPFRMAFTGSQITSMAWANIRSRSSSKWPFMCTATN
jgi:N-methylhydantoinase B